MAQALYDLDYEQNRLCVIRALSIAMSFWIESMDVQKDACHWIQIAWSLSRRAGLDRDPVKMSMERARAPVETSTVLVIAQP